jgi:nucleoside-diphosphate-sugar epimerase
MKILIIGATGGSGRLLVTQALGRGHTVTPSPLLDEEVSFWLSWCAGAEI